MEKIKDFFYNKNDILVAIIILAIAAAVIIFRIDAIMEYPKTLVEQQQQTVEENAANAEQQAPVNSDANTAHKDTAKDTKKDVKKAN